MVFDGWVDAPHQIVTALVSLGMFGLGAYFVGLAYWVWFKISPLAVRHVCGAAGYFALGILSSSTTSFDRRPSTSELAILLGCIAVVLVFYRVSYRMLNRLLFPLISPNDAAADPEDRA